MSHSEQINELAAALSKAQGSMKAATFNKVNPHFKSKYADLAAVWEAIRDPLSKNGLAVTQTMEWYPANEYGSLNLLTTLHHSSGQWLRSVYPLPNGAKPQELGSALTYARRYSLSAIVGIAADEDDDANEAQKATPVVKTDPGEPREIPLGDSPDWAWFGRQMANLSKNDRWLGWRSANMVNMKRMESEAPKEYALMLAQLQKGRASA